jgi:hypothetical protein
MYYFTLNAIRINTCVYFTKCAQMKTHVKLSSMRCDARNLNSARRTHISVYI